MKRWKEEEEKRKRGKGRLLVKLIRIMRGRLRFSWPLVVCSDFFQQGFFYNKVSCCCLFYSFIYFFLSFFYFLVSIPPLRFSTTVGVPLSISLIIHPNSLATLFKCSEGKSCNLGILISTLLFASFLRSSASLFLATSTELSSWDRWSKNRLVVWKSCSWSEKGSSSLAICTS